MICTGPAVAEAIAGGCEPALAEAPAGVPGRCCDLREGFPLCSTGRSLSSSTAGGATGVEEVAGAGVEAAGGLVCGVACGGVAGGSGSGGLGFFPAQRRYTGGASST